MAPGSPRTYPAFLAAVRKEKAEGRPIEIMRGKSQFQPFDLGREVDLEVLYAYPGSVAGLGSGNTLLNNTSIVLKLTYGRHTFLSMGDAEGKGRRDPPDQARSVEKLLLDTYPAAALHATVLKVAHHGSETASTLPFIAAVAPEVVVVHSGREAFGGTFLPDTTTLRRFCQHNAAIRVHRTDRDDAAAHRTVAADADSDNVVVRTNGSLEVTACSHGTPRPVTRCSTR